MDQATARAFDRDTQGQPVTKTATATSDKKDRRDNPIYASRDLDEYGLTPNELRVYFRIARRAGEEGKCWESIPNMARAIGLGESTVRRCSRILALARLTSEQPIEGWTTERRINPISRWKNKAELPGIRDIVLRSEDKRAPVTRDRGIARAPVTADGPPLSRETGALLSPQQGLPLSPQTVEGIPSEGIPIEVHPKKEIPHTHSAQDGEASAVEPVVCVPIPLDLTEIRKQYAEAHSNLFCKQIKNPGGWLIAARDGRYDEIVLQWWREEQEKAERQKTIHDRLAAEQAEHDRQVQELRASRAKEDEAKAAEWEREAPERERQRLEKRESERRANLDACKKLWKQFAHNPTFRDSQIAMLFPDDEASRVEWAKWLANGESDYVFKAKSVIR